MNIVMVDIVQMSLLGSILAMLVILIRAVGLHKLPKTTFPVLWGVVLLRFLLPFGVEADTDVYTLVQEATGVQIPAISGTTGSVGSTVLPAAAPLSETGTVVSTQEILLLVWIVGICIFSAVFVALHIASRRKLRFAWKCKEETVRAWFARQEPQRKRTVLISDRISTPLSFGVFRPKIVLPGSMDFADAQQVNYVLAHEEYHIKSLDSLWKTVAMVAVCLHWFNPFAWIMLVLLTRDLELRCDEKVLRQFGVASKTEYAGALIEMAQRKRSIIPVYSGFSKNAAEERVRAIMKIKKTSLTAMLTAVVLVLGVTSACAVTGLGSAQSAEFHGTAELRLDGAGSSNDGSVGNYGSRETYYVTKVTSVQPSWPSILFIINLDDVAKVELSCQTEHMHLSDFMEIMNAEYEGSYNITASDSYAYQVATANTEGEQDGFYTEYNYRSFVMEFSEDFDGYEHFQYKWFAEQLSNWARENDAVYNGVNKGLAYKEREAFGHIQLDGYDPDLLTDRITMTATDFDGNTKTSYIDIVIYNNTNYELVVEYTLNEE